jgi:hypothetical protein
LKVKNLSWGHFRRSQRATAPRLCR